MSRVPLPPWLQKWPFFEFLRPYLRRLGDPKRLWLGGLLVLALTVLLSSNLIPDKISLRVGDLSPEEIRAHRSVKYVDIQETQRLRSEAERRVPKIYDEVPYAATDVVQNITETFRIINGERSSSKSSPSPALNSLRHRLPINLSDSSLLLLFKSSPDGFYALQKAAERLAGQAMSADLRDAPSDLPAERDRINAEARKLPFSPSERIAIGELVGNAIKPNQVLNLKKTERLREEERMSVTPVRLTLLRGEVILHKDERVTPEHIEKLQALGLQQPALDWSRVGFLGLVLGVFVYLFSLYLREYQPAVYKDYRRLTLLAVLVTVSVIGLKIGTTILGLKVDSSTIGYLNMLWIATASMLVSVLVGPHVAVTIAALLSVGTGLSLDIELRFVTAALISSLAGIYAASHLRDRSCLVRMGVTLTVTNVAIVLLLSGFGGDLSGTFLLGLGWAAGCGIGTALLFWLGVAVLERPFGVTTHVGLLELCDTNRPILKRLLMEAPGTYHHSLVVASLVESAAEGIGADPLLGRAMAYYHDIGKLRRPQFFVENQRVENMHDRLSPSLSMLVIAAHVRDGYEMGRELRLPPPILDGIREHHGTGLVKYFYHQALGENTPSTELEQQFRYDGPKPQTKETAILMLADGVEAASRVLVKATPGQIEDLVNRLVHERLADGQLDECDLTFRDLETISQLFIRTLTGMLHSRIEYPKVITASEAKKVLRYAAFDSKPKTDERPEPAAAEGSGPTAAAS
jgi:putative nucleotidyltransferase with HDIG domain